MNMNACSIRNNDVRMKSIKLFVPAILAFGTAGMARAQFVWPRASYHNTDPSVYKEDPFITKYRKMFFSVFQGDFKTFYKGYDEIKAMVKKNPNDARALVWLGNGETIKAGLQYLKGDQKGALTRLATSRQTLDRAVALEPQNPGIYMMRAATLYVQGQYFPSKELPPSVWLDLIADCKHLARHLGPANMKKMSIHVRGETYGEMGVAYMKLHEPKKAIQAFKTVISLDPHTDYSKKAKIMISQLETSHHETSNSNK